MNKFSNSPPAGKPSSEVKIANKSRNLWKGSALLKICFLSENYTMNRKCPDQGLSGFRAKYNFSLWRLKLTGFLFIPAYPK